MAIIPKMNDLEAAVHLGVSGRHAPRSKWGRIAELMEPGVPRKGLTARERDALGAALRRISRRPASALQSDGTYAVWISIKPYHKKHYPK